MKAARPRVRVAQLVPTLGDVSANLSAMLEAAKLAEQDDVDLLVFPELALTGYGLRDHVSECALTRDAPEIRALIDASQRVSLAFGFVEESPQHLFFNSAA